MAKKRVKLTPRERRNRDRTILRRALRRLGFSPEQADRLKNSKARLDFLRAAKRAGVRVADQRRHVTTDPSTQKLVVGTERARKRKRLDEDEKREIWSKSSSKGGEFPPDLQTAIDTVETELLARDIKPKRANQLAHGLVNRWWIDDAFDITDIDDLIAFVDEY